MTTSRFYKALTRAEIVKVVSDLYGAGTKISECTLMKGGVFNATYRVRTDTDPDGICPDGIILRAAPVNRDLLFDFERSMMSAEPAFYQLLGEKNIPSSEVIRYDNSCAVIDREYIIFRYIRSIPMNDSAVPQDATPGLYQQLGEIIARLHAIQAEQFGWQRPAGELQMYDRWGAFLKRFADEVAARCSKYGLFQGRALARFTDVFADEAVFDRVKQARMVHADLWEGNVLVCENEGSWDVAALIDIDKAIFGDKYFEFLSPALLNDDFLRGYGPVIYETPEAVFRRNAYGMLGCFVQAYIWSVQFDNREWHESAKRNGLEALDGFS